MAGDVLIVGWDDGLVAAGLRLGLTPVVVARQAQLRGREAPEGTAVIRVEDTARLESVLGALRRNDLSERPYLAIHSNSERGMAISAALGSLLRKPSISWSTALAFRDKAIQKGLVGTAGCRTARFGLVEGGGDPLDAAAGLAYPLVLKPVAGVAVEFTHVVRSRAALERVFERLRRSRGDGHAYLLEEYVLGAEWHIDGVVSSGEIAFLSAGRYGSPCIDFPRRGVMREFLFDPARDSVAFLRARSLATRALPALGLTDGVFHMEAFDDGEDEELVFGECGARIGGGLLRRGVELKHGVDLATASMQIACGMAPTAAGAGDEREVGIAYLMSPAGRLVSWPSREEMLAQPGVEGALLDARAGMRVRRRPRSGRDRLAEVLVATTAREELIARLEQMEDWFRERSRVAV